MQTVDLVLTGGFVVPEDSASTVLSNAAVAVDGSRIVEVGAATDVGARYSARRVIDTTDHAVLPGLVDCHLHTCQTTARGLADDVPVTTWLDRILGFEARLEAQDVEASVRLTVLELIKSGTTGLIEGCAPPAYVDVVGEVLAASGLRAVLTRSTMERADPTVLPAPTVLRMATFDGAQAARWPEVGTLRPGNKADLIVVSLKQPHLMPLNDVISNLVYCANGHDVVTTIVDGRILMDSRQVVCMDEDRILQDAANSAARMVARLG